MRRLVMSAVLLLGRRDARLCRRPVTEGRLNEAAPPLGAEPVAVAADGQHVAVVQEPVELAPFERAIGLVGQMEAKQGGSAPAKSAAAQSQSASELGHSSVACTSFGSKSIFWVKKYFSVLPVHASLGSHRQTLEF
jgi:hypothetical protein